MRSSGIEADERTVTAKETLRKKKRKQDIIPSVIVVKGAHCLLV